MCIRDRFLTLFQLLLLLQLATAYGQELNGEKPCKNPRNAAAGSLRQKDPKVTRGRNLDIFVFNLQLIEGETVASHASSLECMKELGFHIIPFYTRTASIDDVIAEVERIGTAVSYTHLHGAGNTAVHRRPAVLGWPADELSLFDGLPHVHHRHAGSAEPLPERNDQTGGCKVFNGKSAGRRLVFHVMGEGDVYKRQQYIIWRMEHCEEN